MPDLVFQQAATIVNSLYQQATGKTDLTATDLSSFVSVGQAVLSCGTNQVVDTLTQLMGNTIFAIRPYYAKFTNLYANEERWGMVTRKINYANNPVVDNEEYELTDGAAIDHYRVNKPKVLETKFYGGNTYMATISITRNQLNTSFRGPEELLSFHQSLLTSINNDLEQYRENNTRAVIANLIGAKNISNDSGVLHLVTMYNDYLGLDGTTGKEKKTLNDLRTSSEYKTFMLWVYSQIASYADLLTERSYLYHTNITNFNSKDYSIPRFTPYDRQKVFILNSDRYAMEKMVLADIYHDNYLALSDVNTVNYWQSIETPDSINVTPSVLQSDGSVTTGTAQNLDNIFAVIIDEDAAGYTLKNQWSAATPINAFGGYYNLAFHETYRYWNDQTENALVFMLD